MPFLMLQPPDLFGDKFAKEAKDGEDREDREDREDQLQCLNWASGRGRNNHHFQHSRPLAPRRGGGNSAP